MITKKLENYLQKHNIVYNVISHKTVYTAYDLAKTTKKKLKSIAKTVAVKADKKYMLVVVPASHRLDLAKLKKRIGVRSLAVVKEVELSRVFKIKPGTIVPFATFHNVPIYVDKTLLKSRVILVSGGSHKESLEIKAKTLLERGAEALSSFSKKHLSDTPAKKTAGKKKTVQKRAAKK